jgi:Flp pilus assembly protein TadD
LPILDAVWLSRTRAAVGSGTIAVLAAYGVNIARQRRSEQGVSWTKVLLALSTGAIYWFSGRLSTNLVVGIAMFEIFHAVQYYAIVWSYNRRLAERAGARFGFLGFLFREKWSMLGLYLAAIAAFGSIRYLAGAPDDEGTLARHADLFAILTAVFSASTLLHFYFDGFIWKVSDRTTAANLEVAGGVALVDRYTPALIHLGKWGAFYAAALGLMFLQYQTTAQAAAVRRAQAEPYTAARGAYLTGDREIVEALARWTPNLPESQLQAARIALDSGDYDTATRLAQRAAAMRPRAHEALAILGQAQLYGRQFSAAAETFRRAIALEPARWRYQLGLAQALDSDGRTSEALDVLQSALDAAPDEPELAAEWVSMVEREAEQYYRARRYAEARAAYGGLLAMAPERNGDRFRLGQIELDQQDYRAASATFRRLVERTPDEPKARMLLGVALMELNEAAEAEQQLREAMRLAPRDPDPHYNLALFLLRSGKTNEARDHVQAAQRLGLQPSPEVLRAAGL